MTNNYKAIVTFRNGEFGGSVKAFAETLESAIAKRNALELEVKANSDNTGIDARIELTAKGRAKGCAL